MLYIQYYWAQWHSFQYSIELTDIPLDELLVFFQKLKLNANDKEIAKEMQDNEPKKASKKLGKLLKYQDLNYIG